MKTHKELFETILAGKKIRNKHWDKTEYLQLIDNNICDQYKTITTNYCFSKPDFWEIYTGDEQLKNHKEIYKALLDGKKLRNVRFCGKKYYVHMVNGILCDNKNDRIDEPFCCPKDWSIK